MSEVLTGSPTLSPSYHAAWQQKWVKDFPSYFEMIIKTFFFKLYGIITFWNINILPSIPTWNGKWLSDKRCLVWPVSLSSKITMANLGLKTQINRNSLGLQLAGLSKPGAVPLNMVLDSLIHAISLQIRGSCLLSDYALGFGSLQIWDSTVQSLNTTYISSCNEPKPASVVW